MDDAIRDTLRRRADELAARPALEKAQVFLRSWVASAETLEEAGEGFRELSPSHVRDALNSIEALLGEAQEPGALASLVGWDANWVLDDPSDAGAAVFLREVARLLRAAL